MNINTRKYNVLIAIIFTALLLLPAHRAYGAEVSPVTKDALIEWNPVCRHDTLYWISVVRDQYPVRVAFGKVIDPTYDWHVQPQLLLGDNWYYFEVKEDKVHIILNMEELYEGWVLLYSMEAKDYVGWLFGWEEK